MSKEKNLYEILGVDKNASEEDLKKAFRNLSKQYHPDALYGKSDEEKKQAEEKKKAEEAKPVIKVEPVVEQKQEEKTAPEEPAVHTPEYPRQRDENQRRSRIRLDLKRKTGREDDQARADGDKRIEQNDPAAFGKK